MDNVKHVAITVEMEKHKTIKKIARGRTLMELREETKEHTQLQG